MLYAIIIVLLLVLVGLIARKRIRCEKCGKWFTQKFQSREILEQISNDDLGAPGGASTTQVGMGNVGASANIPTLIIQYQDKFECTHCHHIRYKKGEERAKV